MKEEISKYILQITDAFAEESETVLFSTLSPSTEGVRFLPSSNVLNNASLSSSLQPMSLIVVRKFLHVNHD
eukprot:CAMPEP_0194111716 /NCGR_PEP_ID=MMETSP0150-20130528/10658_1 /TAXON_ID=122233 /ORGANISM="Chaetoceros debilis, Strain MM31A-1" /LENGTH=70 /DNA_ID=CAMNT_0038801217 /DNA_START=313 /DNA_END=525 /DNA_ORIENTATION=-